MAHQELTVRFGGIRAKILLSFVLLGVAMSGIMSTIFYLRMKKNMEAQLDDLAKLTALNLAQTSDLAILMGERKKMEELIGKILADAESSGAVYGCVWRKGAAWAQKYGAAYEDKNLAVAESLTPAILSQAESSSCELKDQRLILFAVPIGKDRNAEAGAAGGGDDLWGGGTEESAPAPQEEDLWGEAGPAATEPTPMPSAEPESSTQSADMVDLAVVAFSREPLAAKMRADVLLWGLVSVVVAIVAGVLISLVLDALIAKPIKETTQIALKIAGGSLGERAPVRSRDEVGLLADAFNRMSDSLQEQLVRSEEMSRSMQSAMERSNILVENVAQAIQQLSTSTSSILAVSAEQASGAAEQAASVQEANTTSEEIATMARMISDNASSMEGTAESMVQRCREGLKVVQEAIQAMGEIRTQVDLLQQNMIGLNENSQQVNEIVETINWFADQSNLVALNASIEAVGAGDAGIRFGAVANELRELARNINDQTRQIRERATQIQTSIASTVVATENGAKRVEMGAEVVGRVRESFEGIMDLVTKAGEAIKHIHVSTKQQEGACSELASNISGVASVATQVAQNAEQTERSMNELDQLAARLRQLLAEEQI